VRFNITWRYYLESTPLNYAITVFNSNQNWNEVFFNVGNRLVAVIDEQWSVRFKWEIEINPSGCFFAENFFGGIWLYWKGQNSLLRLISTETGKTVEKIDLSGLLCEENPSNCGGNWVISSPVYSMNLPSSPTLICVVSNSEEELYYLVAVDIPLLSLVWVFDIGSETVGQIVSFMDSTIVFSTVDRGIIALGPNT